MLPMLRRIRIRRREKTKRCGRWCRLLDNKAGLAVRAKKEDGGERGELKSGNSHLLFADKNWG